MILKVREEKRRPKLTTILSMFRDKQDPEEKAKFLARIKKIYQREGQQDLANEDPKYERLV